MSSNAEEVLSLIEKMSTEPDRQLRVLEYHRLAFELHKFRIENGGGKGIEFLDATNPIARFRFTVGFEGTPLSEPQVPILFRLLAEAFVDGNVTWACSALDTLLKSDCLLRGG